MQESKDEIARELRAKEIYRVGTRAHIDFNIISKAITNDTPINEWKTFVLETLTAQKSTLGNHQLQNLALRQLILDKSEGNTIGQALSGKSSSDETSAGKERWTRSCYTWLATAKVEFSSPKRAKQTRLDSGRG